MSLLVAWIVFFSVMYTLSSLLIVTRLYLRYKNRRFGMADWLTAFCLLLSTIMLATGMYGGVLNFTYPGQLYRASFKKAALSLFMFEMTSMILVAFSKCCVTLLLLEVEPNRSWRRGLLIVQGLILATGLVNVAINFFGCYVLLPGAYYSAFMQGFATMAANQLDQRHCVVRKQWIPLNGAMNVLFEVAIFICAMSLVSRMKSTSLQKAGLAVTFSLGLVTMTATIMSTYVSVYNYYWELSHFDAVIVAEQYHRAGIWLAIEAYTGLIVGSLLPIRATIFASISRLVDRLHKRPSKALSNEDSNTTVEMSLNDKLDLQESGLTIAQTELTTSTSLTKTDDASPV